VVVRTVADWKDRLMDAHDNEIILRENSINMLRIPEIQDDILELLGSSVKFSKPLDFRHDDDSYSRHCGGGRGAGGTRVAR
jgi:hypothetical protein